MLACRSTLPLSCFLLLFLVVQAFGDNTFTRSRDSHPDSELTDSANQDRTAGLSTDSDPTMGAGTVPLDVDNYPVPPPELGLELEQVHLYVRHGESTTTHICCCRVSRGTICMFTSAVPQ